MPGDYRRLFISTDLRKPAAPTAVPTVPTGALPVRNHRKWRLDFPFFTIQPKSKRRHIVGTGLIAAPIVPRHHLPSTRRQPFPSLLRVRTMRHRIFQTGLIAAPVVKRHRTPSPRMLWPPQKSKRRIVYRTGLVGAPVVKRHRMPTPRMLYPPHRSRRHKIWQTGLIAAPIVKRHRLPIPRTLSQFWRSRRRRLPGPAVVVVSGMLMKRRYIRPRAPTIWSKRKLRRVTPWYFTCSGSVVCDRFTDTNGLALASHTPDVSPGAWTQLTGSIQIQNNQAKGISLDANLLALAALDAGVANCTQSIELTPSAVTSAGYGIVGRLSDALNYWEVDISVSTNQVRLFEVVGGAYTSRAVQSLTFLNGTTYTVSVQWLGTSVAVYVNGAFALDYQFASSNFAATKFGLDLPPGWTADNFKITTLVQANAIKRPRRAALVPVLRLAPPRTKRRRLFAPVPSIPGPRPRRRIVKPRWRPVPWQRLRWRRFPFSPFVPTVPAQPQPGKPRFSILDLAGDLALLDVPSVAGDLALLDVPDLSTVVYDNMESVEYTFTRLGRAGGSITAQLDNCLRRSMDISELSPSGGVYVGHDTRLIVPRESLPFGSIPEPRDTWQDQEGELFTVLRVSPRLRDSSRLYQSYWCESRNLVLAYNLRDVIDIERAEITYDGAGMKRKNWPSEGGRGLILYAKLAARVQDTADDVIEELGIKGFRGTHVVTIGKQVPLLTFEDRIKVLVSNQLGVQQTVLVPMYLDIVGIRNPQQIGELVALDTVLQP